MSHVVVVGGGVGGLASAMLLAARGHQVTVLERGNEFGGSVWTATHDGHTFDIGANRLLLPAVFRDLFLKTGSALEDSVELVALESADTYLFESGLRLDMPGAGVGRSCDAVADALGATAADQWRRLMQMASHMWTQVRAPYIEQWDAPSQSAFAAWRMLRASGATWTVDQLLSHMDATSEVRALVERYALMSGHHPQTAPATLAVLPYLELTFGAHRIEGGMRNLVGAMAQRATELGAQLHMGADVVSVQHDGRGVPLVHTVSGESIGCDAVVIAAALPSPSEPEVPNDYLSHHVTMMKTHGAQAVSRSVIAFESARRHNVVELSVQGESQPGQVQDQSWVVRQPVDNASVPLTPQELFDSLVASGAVAAGSLVWATQIAASQWAKRTGTAAIAPRPWRASRSLRYWRSSLADPWLAPRVIAVGARTHPGAGLPMVAVSARRAAALLADTL